MSDQTKNFAYSTTSAAVTSGATSFSVQSGHGSRFPATSGGAYNLVVYDPRYPNASVAYQNSACEIVRVTTRSTDTFSVITRAQEGTSAIAWGADWRVEMNVTAKNFEEASASLSGIVSTGTQTFAGAKTFTGALTAQSNATVGASTATDGTVRFLNSGDSNYIDVVSPVSPSSNYTLTLPAITDTIATRTKVKSILAWCQSGNYNSNSTNYATFGLMAVTQSADNFKISLPACTVSALKCFSSSNSINGATVITIRKNGSDTAVTATIAQGGTTGSDTTNSVSFAEDDEISFKVASAGNSGTLANLSVTVTLTTF